ncbi:MAG: DUF503 domain-containing protein [bacterium]
MVVGVCRVELYIPEANSLKTKRKVIKSLKDRIRQKFNVSVAEIELQDLWQRTVLGVAAISNDKKQIDAALNKVISFIEHANLAIIGQYQIEIW